MRGCLLAAIVCVFPFLGHTETIAFNNEKKPLEFEIAPLIPLEPQFPLELTQANRELFMENPERLKEVKRSIQQELDKHSFPWLTMITLLGCGGIGWAIYLMRDRWPQRPVKVIPSLSSQQQMEHALQALGKYFPEPHQIPAYYAQLASLLLEALQARLEWKIIGLTTPELAKALKKQSPLSSQQTAEILSILTEMDQIKFAGKKPLREEITHIFQKVQNFILNNRGKKR